MSINVDNNIYSSSMFNMIDNIVEVVVNSYYYWADAQTREDLMQEGFLKAYELLKTGNYDPNQNLRNYLYTGVRNAMSNLNYHYGKEKHSSYDLYNDNIEEGSYDPNYIMGGSTFVDYTIDPDIIQKSCEKFHRPEYIGNVMDYFISLGLTFDGSYIKSSEPTPIILKAIIVDVLWSI